MYVCQIGTFCMPGTIYPTLYDRTAAARAAWLPSPSLYPGDIDQTLVFEYLADPNNRTFVQNTFTNTTLQVFYFKMTRNAVMCNSLYGEMCLAYAQPFPITNDFCYAGFYCPPNSIDIATFISNANSNIYVSFCEYDLILDSSCTCRFTFRYQCFCPMGFYCPPGQNYPIPCGKGKYND